jgi:hypothetical protein
LLIEEARTNFIADSRSSSLPQNGTTRITSSTVLAPDGTFAVRIGETNTLGKHGCYYSLSGLANNTQTTFSIYAKAAEKNWVSIGFQDVSFGYNKYTAFDLSTGTIGTNTHTGTIIFNPASASITPVGNGWYRLSVSRGTNAANAFVWMSNSNPTGSSYDGNAQFDYQGGTSSDGVYLFGAQVEEAPFGAQNPTSYIPTSGSTVTRSADVASLTNSSIYNTDSFTILNEPFGSAAGSSTLSLVGAGATPIKRTAVYSQELTQTQINASVGKTDEFWRWRILGSSFGLPGFLTDGQVTVDWGDGTVETLTTSDHTFTDGGGYHEIGFRLDSGTYFRPYINNNATHKDKVVAVGPAPESMVLHGEKGFWGCSNLESFDATVDATGGTDFTYAWGNCTSLTSFPTIDTSSGTSFYVAWSSCTSLTSFPLIDTSSGTNFTGTWGYCSSLASFPLINTSSGTSFSYTWRECSSLTSFPAIDTSSGTSFTYAWYNNNSLTSFPLIDTSSGTNFSQTWRNCTSLTSFPLINTSSGTNFGNTWNGCSSLTSFPAIDISSGTIFSYAWLNCSSLTTFPANFFDSWTGTPGSGCFSGTWSGCYALTATSVENILNSIDTSGQSAPASGVDITIDYDTGTGTPSIATAVTNLKSRGWTITLNGVAQ